uniref:Reverse transcriptase domain-containing protein n=1 Tax=Schistocephalus solidus TaxID=70667 RepID=A0A183SG91_SCHSO
LDRSPPRHLPDEALTATPTKAPSNQITEKLENLHSPDNYGTVETRWCQLRNVIQSTALEVLGRARRQHQDWLDDNDADISNLLAEKNGLHKAYMDLRTDATKAAFFRCRRLVQQRLREMQDAWMLRKAEEIQGYVDRNEMKNFFKAIKAIYGPCIKGSATLLSSDGTTLLTEKSQLLKRWAEHFRSVLSCSSAISDAAIDRFPQVDTNNDLDLLPSLPETIRAVQQISSGKAPGSDAIPPKFYKHGGPRLMAELTTFFGEIWRQGQVPLDFKDATIVHLCKRKGNRQLCDNHRGITLLNIPGKIFALRPRNFVERMMGDPQAALTFVAHRRPRETDRMPKACTWSSPAVFMREAGKRAPDSARHQGLLTDASFGHTQPSLVRKQIIPAAVINHQPTYFLSQFFLQGGYFLNSLEEGCVHVLKALLGDELPPLRTYGVTSSRSTVKRVVWPEKNPTMPRSLIAYARRLLRRHVPSSPPPPSAGALVLLLPLGVNLATGGDSCPSQKDPWTKRQASFCVTLIAVGLGNEYLS